MIMADGFDEAVLGVARQFNQRHVAYSVEKGIEILMRDGMTEEEAIEYYEFNIVGAWVGQYTPVFVEGRTADEVRESDFVSGES